MKENDELKEILKNAKPVTQIEIVQQNNLVEDLESFQNRVNILIAGIEKKGGEILNVWTCKATGHFTINILYKIK